MSGESTLERKILSIQTSKNASVVYPPPIPFDQPEQVEEAFHTTPEAVRSFLAAMWPSEDLAHQLVPLIPNKENSPHEANDVDHALELASLYRHGKRSCAFTCCEFSLGIDNITYLPTAVSAFWVKLKIGNAGYEDASQAVAAVNDFCYEELSFDPTHVIGTSAHVYAVWVLQKSLEYVDWNLAAQLLRRLSEDFGLLGDLNHTTVITTDLLLPGTTDFASVPGKDVVFLKAPRASIENARILDALACKAGTLGARKSKTARTSVDASKALDQSPDTILDDLFAYVKATREMPIPTLSKSGASAVTAANDVGTQRPRRVTALEKYSLLGKTQDIENQMVDAVAILGQIALKGQATAIFAAPNTGKTLITLHLLLDGIRRGAIDKSNLFYFNLDDSGPGFVAKLNIAGEYGFHTVVEGFGGFEPDHYRKAMLEMIETDTASDVVVVLDTLKNFVDVMHKTRSKEFTHVVRQFVRKGGSLIALAHTNKHPSANGKPVPAGTSDIVDDFDCAYTMAALPHQPDPERCVVQFNNIKRRGNVAKSASFSYASAADMSYDERLLSVAALDPDKFSIIEAAAAVLADGALIDVVKACIAEGINQKMKLVDALKDRTRVSRQAALQVIQRYLGDDPLRHHWQHRVEARGAKVFYLLNASPRTH